MAPVVKSKKHIASFVKSPGQVSIPLAVFAQAMNQADNGQGLCGGFPPLSKDV
jgi:hypothetical protein